MCSLVAYEFPKQWILDSGANWHMTRNLNMLCDYKPGSISNVQIANGKMVSIVGQGTAYVSDHLKLYNVLYIPECAPNLISLSYLSDDDSYYVIFTSKKVMLVGMSSEDDWWYIQK